MAKRRMLAILFAAMAVVSAHAAPVVYNDPNNIVVGQWTRQAAAARAKAAQLQRPMLVFFGNSTGCSKCKAWETNTLATDTWKSYLNSAGLILIWVDRSYSESEYNTQKKFYGIDTVSFGYPKIFVMAPNGAKLDTFEATGALKNAASFIARIRPKFDLYPYNPQPGTIGFTATTASVSEDAGSLTVTVSRSGGSAGAQTFSYATSNGTATAGTHYSEKTGNLTWAAGDAASKSFNINLFDDGIWTTPETRTFTVQLAKVTGTATLGTALLTVTINESSENLPGIVGFSLATDTVKEGNIHTGYVSRVGGTTGAASADLSLDGAYSLEPTTFSWADGDGATKQFTISDIDITPGYDRRMIEVTLSNITGSTGGQLTQSVTVLDQEVTQTLDEYQVGKSQYEPFATAESDFWFYSATEGALRSEPLSNGDSSSLSWIAPEAGRLTFTWGQTASTTSTYTATVAGVGALNLSIPRATNSVALNSGEKIVWQATEPGATPDYIVTLKIVSWEALAAATPTAPAANVQLQKGDIADNHSLVDLEWESGAGNPSDAMETVVAGSTVATAIDRGVATSGVNAVDDLAIVNPLAVVAQGDVFWRVDTTVAGDLGVVTASSSFIKFSVVDLPEFDEDAPAASSTLNVFLKVGTSVPIPVTSATPVTFSANLPAGMQINPTTGKITGTPTKSGTYSVTVNATNNGGTSSRKFNIVVQALPAYAKGKFQGAVFSGDTLFGSVALSVTTSGRLSAKLQSVAGNVSLRGIWQEVQDGGTLYSELTASGGRTLKVTLTSSGLMTLDFNGMTGFAHGVDKNALGPYVGYYTTLINADNVVPNAGSINNVPEGQGFLAITVSRTGSTRYKGRLPDGVAVSGSALLSVYSAADVNALGYNEPKTTAKHAALPIFKALYSRRGYVAGLAWIEGRLAFGAGNNRVWLDDSQWYYPGKSAVMKEDGFLAPLNNIAGGYMSATAELVGALFVKPANFSGFASHQFVIDSATLPVVASATTIGLESGNALSGRISVNRNTGLLKGRITPPGQRAVSVYGAVVPEFLVGGGFYLVQDADTGSYRLKRSYYVGIE